MISYLRNNIGYPSKKGFIPKGLPGTSEIDINYDPNYARKLVNDFIEEINPKKEEIKMILPEGLLDL